MKFTLGIILTLGLSISLSAQNVPNGNFEGPPFTWAGIGGGTLAIGGQSKMAQPNGDTLVVKAFEGRGTAFITNTDKASGLTAKFPFDLRPDSFIFHYNFIPFGNDVAGAKVVLTRYDVKTMSIDTVLNETILITDTVSSSYKRIAFYIGDKYKKTEKPDSAYIDFRPSMSGPVTMNSYMTLDNIDLVLGNNASVTSMDAKKLIKISPNPLSDHAIISYDLKTSASVSISLYDLNGKEVLGVLNTVQNVGTHETELNVATLNAGVYFCKTTIGNNSTVQRIVISR